MGAKSALSIGAACACVGFVLGITTLTGMGFKFSAWVIDLSGIAAQMVLSVDVFGWFALNQVTILFGLFFTAAACIVMGSGVPTTPTYIILAAIVAPALAQLGVPQLATHFFVFYFGVLADVTPPVALAAFAAAGIARSEPMRTGMTAFRLSMGKALVPFAFVYTPALLLIDFSWSAFLIASGVGDRRRDGAGRGLHRPVRSPHRAPGLPRAEPVLAVAGVRQARRCRRSSVPGRAGDPVVAPARGPNGRRRRLTLPPR